LKDGNVELDVRFERIVLSMSGSFHPGEAAFDGLDAVTVTDLRRERGGGRLDRQP
jgi:hypothetical protein